ncbi:hypothetical protein ACFE04_031805 [Oxalis oulophora]
MLSGIRKEALLDEVLRDNGWMLPPPVNVRIKEAWQVVQGCNIIRDEVDHVIWGPSKNGQYSIRNGWEALRSKKTEVTWRSKQPPPTPPLPPPSSKYFFPRTLAGAYDHLELHLQWPLGYCQKPGSNCDATIHKPLLFTIHGLWLSLANGDPAPQTYGSILIEPIIDRFERELLNNLETYWPSLKYKHNKKFWVHEYNLHATTALTLLKNRPQSYFEKTLDLRSSKDILKTIRVKIQGDSTTLQYSGVEATLDGLYGKDNYFLKCYKERTDNVLNEVGVCYDKLEINNNSCPNKKVQDGKKSKM